MDRFHDTSTDLDTLLARLDGAPPELLPVHLMPPVRTQADLARTWRGLMGELGFGRSSVWLLFLEVGGTVTPDLLAIDDMPDRPERFHCEQLVAFAREVMTDGYEAGSVAFLRSRPGPHPATPGDLAWAAGIAAAAARQGVATHPLHLATDQDLTVVAADDLL